MVVSVMVSNRGTHFTSAFPREQLREFFSFHPKGYQWMPRYKSGEWDGKIHLLRYNRLPTGLFRAFYQTLEKRFGIRFDIHYNLLPVRFSSDFESDRNYQTDCVRKMQEASQMGGGLILSATGSGKTRMVGLVFKTLEGPAVFVVDELTLMKQAEKELALVTREPIGQIGNMEFRPERITVATIQTLHRHRNTPHFLAWASSLKIMVIDELHLALNRRNFSVVHLFKPPAVFGLTATLELKKRDVLMRSYALAGPPVFEYSLAEGTQEGFLTPGVVVQLIVDSPSFTSPRWVEDYRRLVVRNETRNKVVENLAREVHNRGRSVVILVEWIEHLKTLSTRLQDIPHRIVYGDVDVEDRVEAKDEFDRGDVRLLIVNRVFKKGIDLKRIDCIIEASASRSKNDCVQKFGRGVRLCQGKTVLIYFDIGDAGNRFSTSAESRRRAFRSAQIPVYKLDSSTHRGIRQIVEYTLQLSLKLGSVRGINDTDTRKSARTI